MIELIAPVFYRVELIMSQPLPSVQTHNTLHKRHNTLRIIIIIIIIIIISLVQLVFK